MPECRKRTIVLLVGSLLLLANPPARATESLSGSVTRNDEPSFAPPIFRAITPNSWRLPAGTELSISLQTPFSSKIAKIGDPVLAKLKTQLFLDQNTIIQPGAFVEGTITAVDPARSELKAKVSTDHWLDADGAISLQFNSILMDAGRKLRIDAVPAANTAVEEATSRNVDLVVDRNGEITVKGTSKKSKAFGVVVDGIGLVTSPVTSMMVSGVAGAIDPNYSLNSKEMKNSKHKRVKGFFKGMANGLPGAGLVDSAFGKGVDVDLDIGDTIQLTLRQNATVIEPQTN